jgi:hypothetical protein
VSGGVLTRENARVQELRALEGVLAPERNRRSSTIFTGFLRPGEAHCRSLGFARGRLLTYNSASRMAQRNSRSDSQTLR